MKIKKIEIKKIKCKHLSIVYPKKKGCNWCICKDCGAVFGRTFGKVDFSKNLSSNVSKQ